MAMHRQPLFLLGTSEGDEQNIRLGGFDLEQDVFVIHLFQFSECGAIASHDPDVGIVLADPSTCAA